MEGLFYLGGWNFYVYYDDLRRLYMCDFSGMFVFFECMLVMVFIRGLFGQYQLKYE